MYLKLPFHLLWLLVMMGVFKMNRDAWKLKIYMQHYVQKHNTRKHHEEEKAKSLHMIQTLKLMQLAELLK